MNRMLKIFALGVLIFSLASCGARKAKSVTQTTDSLVYIETVREVPVLVSGDSVPFEIQLPCPEKPKAPIKFKSRGKKATFHATIDTSGVLRGECGCEEEKLTILARDRLIDQLHRSHKTETKIITEYKQHWYLKYLWGWFIITVMAIIIYIIFKIYKPL
jgi:hypothetical protein